MCALGLRLLFDTDFLLEVYEQTRKLLLGFKPFDSVSWLKILGLDPVTVLVYTFNFPGILLELCLSPHT